MQTLGLFLDWQVGVKDRASRGTSWTSCVVGSTFCVPVAAGCQNTAAVRCHSQVEGHEKKTRAPDTGLLDKCPVTAELAGVRYLTRCLVGYLATPEGVGCCKLRSEGTMAQLMQTH